MNISRRIKELNCRPDTKNSYSVSEVRVMLNITKASVRKLIKKNYFRVVQIANEYRIIKHDFDTWLDEGGELSDGIDTETRQ